jgi:transketolase
MRDIFFDKFFVLSQLDKSRLVISNDFGAPSLDRYRSTLPTQYINAGISEQNIVSLSAGLALSGMRPVIYSIASFITTRSLEQIKIDLCDMNLPVIIVGVGCGYGYSADGPTHHAIEDIGLISSLANIKIYSPSDKKILSELFKDITEQEGPVYLRLDRGIPDLNIWEDCEPTLLSGYRAKLNQGDYAIVTTSYLTKKMIYLQKMLCMEGIKVDLYDVYEINSVKTQSFTQDLGRYKAIFVVEEHVENTGLGSLVSLAISNFGLYIPVFRYGIPMQLAYAYGGRDELLIRSGLDNSTITKKIKSIISNKPGG